MKGLRCIIAVMLGLMTLGAAQATTIRLDDAGSHPIPPNVQMQWRTLGLGGAATARQMEAQINVAIRLDTRAHAGRRARVYMVLPQDGGSTLQVQWNTQGRLLPGRLGNGERTLVYQGVIPGNTLEDRLQVYLMADGEWMRASRRLEFYFELESE